jgi:hypothetical protein
MASDEMTMTLLHPMRDGRSDALCATDGRACAVKCSMMMIITGHPHRERTRAP